MTGNTRRLAAVVAAAALALSVAACGSDDDGGSSGGESSGSMPDGGSTGDTSGGGSGSDSNGSDAAGGGGGGEFVMAIHADPSGVDPQVAVAGSDNVAIFPAFDSLVSYDPATLELQPGLAESWAFNDDFTELTLILREGVTFHDGTEMNADSVISSMERFKEKGQYPYLDDVVAFEAVSPTEVKLTMEAPNASMPSILAARAGQVVSTAAAETMSEEEFNRAPVGTGPFELVEWRSGDRLVYERYDGYWDPDSVHLDRIEMRVIPDRQAAVNALLSGEIDFSEGLDGSDIDRLQSADGLEVITPVGLWYYQMYLNHAQAPLDDAKVRAAISHAIDRDLLVEGAVNGLGEPAWYPFPDVHWAYDAEMEGIWEYDPDRSRQLLEEAGYPDGVTVTMTHQPSPTETRRAEIVQSQLADVGITLELTAMDLNQGITEYFENQNFNSALFAYPGQIDPTQIYFTKLDSGQFTNVAKREFPGVPELLAQALATDDTEELKSIYAAINEVYAAEVPEIPLYYRQNLTAISDDFTGYVPDLMGQAQVQHIRPAG